eukprot:350512-Chlamydomonas_euryale.AAC.6
MMWSPTTNLCGLGAALFTVVYCCAAHDVVTNEASEIMKNDVSPKLVPSELAKEVHHHHHT